MPIILPRDLPVKAILEQENIFTMSEQRALHQDIRPIHVAIVNLMPNKEETELQLLRMLSNTALQVRFDLIRTQSYHSKHTDESYLNRFYKTFEDIKDQRYDAMIVTGAPVERLHYEEVLYWNELREILDFAQRNVYSTIFICWAAQAAMYHYYGIEKRNLDEKLFGVYEYPVLQKGVLFKGFDDTFWAPQSRCATILREDVEKIPDLTIWADRPDTGVNIVTTKDNRLIFIAGHWEYDEGTLLREYQRDQLKGLEPHLPVNYFVEDDPSKGIRVRWRMAANLFYSNWLNYCVYQETPYDLSLLARKKVAKFGGTSLASAKQFSKVREIVLSAEDRNIIVVSAPGKRFEEDNKVTDLLLEFYELQKELSRVELSEEEYEILCLQRDQVLQITANRFHEIASDLFLDFQVKQKIDEVMAWLLDQTERDEIISRGEYINAQIMAEYLDYEFIDAKELIFFTSEGKLDKHNTYDAIRERLAVAKKVVVPGFYGVDACGKIKTFERGGSDITGSIIASALNCDVYENWTDVDGVMTADPAKSKDAKKIARMTYEELLKMAKGGAQVYHPDAISPLMEVGIPIVIKNTNNPSADGTIVLHEKRK